MRLWEEVATEWEHRTLVSLVVLCLLGGDQSALGFVVPKRSGERGRFFHFMPPKQTPPARATRSGGPPGTAAQPPKKKQKKGQTKNTDTSAPVRTEAERDVMLARMEKELADLDASLAATASQALQKVKESIGDLSATNIGSVIAIGLVQTKALVDNPALLRPPGLDPPSRLASTEVLV